MDNLILISGAGRNVGKTTLMCSFIEYISEKQQVTAVKVSSHHHTITNKQKIIFESEGIIISEEQDNLSSKDTARYLRAGSQKSLFIQISDDKESELLRWLNENIKGLIICESGSLGRYVLPKNAFFVNGVSTTKKVKWDFPFTTVTMENGKFIPGIDYLLRGIT